MPHLIEPKNLLETTDFKKGTIGIESPGVPIVNYSLVISSNEGTVSGIVEVIESTGVNSVRINVTGKMRNTNYGDIIRIINLEGKYSVSVPPPAISTFQEKFEAYLDFDKDWNGFGGFTFGYQSIQNAVLIAAN